MSFASSVKEELMDLAVRNTCCRRSLLYGAMLGAFADGDEISFSTENEMVAVGLSRLVREVCGREPNMSFSMCVGHPKHTLYFQSGKIRRFLNEVDNGVFLSSFCECKTCEQTLLRGIFLAFGTVTDPSRAYHAEFVIPFPVRAEKIDEYLSHLGLSARRICRGKKIGLYYKSSTAIEDLFAEIGSNKVVFDLANARIERDIRNNENRATNCDAMNIGKTVNASRLQTAAIVKLKDCGQFDALPDDLRVTGELRLEYGEDSLSELAARHNPPISKSGLNHRLARLCALAEKVK